MKRGVSFSGAHLVVARQTPVTRQELLQKFVRSDPRQQVRRAMLSSMLLLGHAPEDLFRYASKKSKYVSVEDLFRHVSKESR